MACPTMYRQRKTGLQSSPDSEPGTFGEGHSTDGNRPAEAFVAAIEAARAAP